MALIESILALQLSRRCDWLSLRQEYDSRDRRENSSDKEARLLNREASDFLEIDGAPHYSADDPIRLIDGNDRQSVVMEQSAVEKVNLAHEAAKQSDGNQVCLEMHEAVVSMDG